MDLPDGLPYVDRTVHLIEVPGEEATALGLMIERAPIPVGKSLRDMADAKLAEQERSLRSYTVLGTTERLVNGAPAIELRARWRHPRGLVYNHVVHVAAADCCLTFTTSCRWEQADAASAWAEELLASVQLRSNW